MKINFSKLLIPSYNTNRCSYNTMYNDLLHNIGIYSLYFSALLMLIFNIDTNNFLSMIQKVWLYLLDIHTYSDIKRTIDVNLKFIIVLMVIYHLFRNLIGSPIINKLMKIYLHFFDLKVKTAYKKITDSQKTPKIIPNIDQVFYNNLNKIDQHYVEKSYNTLLKLWTDIYVFVIGALCLTICLYPSFFNYITELPYLSGVILLAILGYHIYRTNIEVKDNMDKELKLVMEFRGNE